MRSSCLASVWGTETVNRTTPSVLALFTAVNLAEARGSSMECGIGSGGFELDARADPAPSHSMQACQGGSGSRLGPVALRDQLFLTGRLFCERFGQLFQGRRRAVLGGRPPFLVGLRPHPEDQLAALEDVLVAEAGLFECFVVQGCGP